MSEPDLPLEEHLASLLAAFDDGLATNGEGKAALPTPVGDAPPEVGQRLQENAACLRLLNRLRPRPSHGATPSTASEKDRRDVDPTALQPTLQSSPREESIPDSGGT